ncbi:hypothetical protein D1B31_18145 [Neobacillus notoginsengisoli]|uniref:Uncharacterized protein n=1 Tax=Neobacillus notoginsengisoli TaxID=1578198 RepID=A0A417YQ84_9BACI|nr:hypothetical protein [Neobacillus notoginsengisoli]RHW36010.1 hypothetical protein D1B31_18145 [Neobacillus notoginsengisoli]
MLTYTNYLEVKDRLTFQEAAALHLRVVQYVKQKDDVFQDLLEDVVKSANSYASTRANWSVQTTEERRDVDSSRTIQHNDFMATLKILARYMKNQGWDSDWIDELGIVEKDRKRFGDFACYIVCINSLNAR